MVEPKCKDECGHKGELCNEKKDNFNCTRDLGHEGQHVACGITNHELKVWEERSYDGKRIS